MLTARRAYWTRRCLAGGAATCWNVLSPMALGAPFKTRTNDLRSIAENLPDAGL